MKKQNSFSKDQGHLDEESLIAYLQGVTNSLIKKHIDKCKECQKLVKGAEIRISVM